MHKVKRFLKRFGVDIAGYTCLLLVIPVGWLPGPGGIPLLVLSLSLLSMHNPWAKRLLDYVKLRSDSLRTIFFPKNRRIELAWDIVAITMFISAFAVSIISDTTIIKILGTGAGAGSTTIFLFNRARLESIQKKFKKQ
jgi:hypothetical protein